MIIAFDKAPSVYVNHHALRAVVASKDVKTANALTEAFADFARPELLGFGEMSDKTILINLDSIGRSRKSTSGWTDRISFPSVLRRTTPSTTGDLRVSACVYLGPSVYTLMSSAI